MFPLSGTENKRLEKTKLKNICATVNQVQRCSPLAQPPNSLSETSLLTEMAEGRVGNILLLAQPSLLTPQSRSSLHGNPCDGTAQKGAQHREHARDPIARHCLVQLYRRGQICDLTNCAIASVTLTCSQNFHYLDSCTAIPCYICWKDFFGSKKHVSIMLISLCCST